MSAKPNSEIAQKFFGAWRYVGTMLDGKPRSGRGANPRGIIVYDPSGHMAVHVSPDRPKPRAGKEPTPEEAHEALKDCVAYFGTYSIDEHGRTVTHHRDASVQPGDAGDVVRGYEFVGDRLILRLVGTTQEVIWERIR